MTKRKMKKWKKILVISVISLLLTAITPISVFWFYPYPRHIAQNKTPIVAEDVFDYPDQILLYMDGKTRILRNDEKISQFNERFWELLGNELRFDAWARSRALPPNDLKVAGIRAESEFCIEFRYKQRRVHTIVWENNWAKPKTFEYDTILVTSRGEIYHSLDAIYERSPYPNPLKLQGNYSDFKEYIYSFF